MMGIFFAPQYFMLQAQAKTITNNSPIHYTIKKGDTFYLLGMRFNSSVGNILSINSKKDPQNLIIGSKVKIPVGYGKGVHYVKKGDTLGNIATKYKTTVKIITDTNFIKNKDLIYQGDFLAIPNIDDFPIDEFSKKLKQNHGDWFKYTVVRIEHGLLKIDNMSANLVPSQYSDKLVRETLKSLGYRIVRGHTMENIECDYRVCGGTKLYTIGKIN